MNIYLDLSRVLAVYIALLVFGSIYNLVVNWLDRKGYLEGFTWLAVAVGCTVTILGIAVIDWQVAVAVLGAFIFSGIPMIWGAVAAYVVKREHSQHSMIDEVLSD